MPLCCMMAPAKMNRGTASSGKLSRPENATVQMVEDFMPAATTTASVAEPME